MTLGLSNRMLARPEVGALVAAIVIFIFFLIVGPVLPVAAVVLHRPLPVLHHRHRGGGVGMLMIGGEFDLSAGVLVTTAGLLNAMFCYQLGINLWVGAVLSLVFCLAIGFLNGYLVMRTGIPSFLITLGTFFVLQGANLGVTKLVTGSVSSPDISQIDGFDIPELDLRPQLPDRIRVALDHRHLVAAVHGARRLHPAAHQDRQLDLRRRRQRRLAPAPSGFRSSGSRSACS